MINGFFILCLVLAIPAIFLAMDFSKGMIVIFRKENAGKLGKSGWLHKKI